MYLNDVAQGGGTYFRRIDFEARPRKGCAVIFFPGYLNGELDPDVLHAALPPVGLKWVSQVRIPPIRGPAHSACARRDHRHCRGRGLSAAYANGRTDRTPQVWIRQSFREDGQPSSPVPVTDQMLEGPLHQGLYQGHCLAGDDVAEAVMTVAQAREWVAEHAHVCQGFTFAHASREPAEPVRVWFKSRLRLMHSDGWWSYSHGNGIA